MKVQCHAHEKDEAHNFTAHEMAELLEKAQDGEAQTVTTKGIKPRCWMEV